MHNLRDPTMGGQTGMNVKFPSRERLLRHQAKMQRRYEARPVSWIAGPGVPPKLYDPDYLWWFNQQLRQAKEWQPIIKAVMCFDKDDVVTIENTP